MKLLDLKTMACITAIVLAPSMVFAGGTNSTSDGKASTGQSKDLDSGMKEGDMGTLGVGQAAKQEHVVIDDVTLATNVKSALKEDPTLSKLDIGSKVSGGVVTLTGVASGERWTSRATIVASSVTGVQSVKNNMTIGH